MIDEAMLFIVFQLESNEYSIKKNFYKHQETRLKDEELIFLIYPEEDEN